MAIRFRGTVYSLPAPNRHHDVIRHIWETIGGDAVDAYGNDQGFLDENGNYLNRKQALVVASMNGQLKDRALGPTLKQLYSEDIW